MCDREQIVAYVDGELDSAAQAVFERHAETCESCRADLRAHRLLICELDAAMAEPSYKKPPRDFARIIAAHAETDMRGVRTWQEHRQALRLILLLAIASFSLLGVSAGNLMIGNGRALVKNILGLSSFLAKAVYDAAISLAVISKVLSQKFLVETRSVGLLIISLGVALLLL